VRVFVAGATGAIGRLLVPMLVAAGHEVTGMTRSHTRAEQLTAAGARAAVADALDERAVLAAVTEAEPEAVINQLTSIPQRLDPRRIERDFALNDRLRSEGARILTGAARAAGARRVIAQSVAFIYEPGPPGTIHVEHDPLIRNPPRPFARTANAVKLLEEQTLQAGGLVLRYGYFYGPGTAIATGGSMATDLRRRRMPIIGDGAGVWSFIHVDDAAGATLAALTRGESGVYNVVDDEPAPVAQWLPALARAIGAPRPMRIPAWLARPLAGEYGLATMTRAQGASNALAMRELDWAPRFASWREGFAQGLG
jgi:nucleoside-diphosphate-sugar epimerase